MGNLTGKVFYGTGGMAMAGTGAANGGGGVGYQGGSGGHISVTHTGSYYVRTGTGYGGTGILSSQWQQYQTPKTFTIQVDVSTLTADAVKLGEAGLELSYGQLKLTIPMDIAKDLFGHLMQEALARTGC